MKNKSIVNDAIVKDILDDFYQTLGAATTQGESREQNL
jgi:hypothetical protein